MVGGLQHQRSAVACHGLTERRETRRLYNLSLAARANNGARSKRNPATTEPETKQRDRCAAVGARLEDAVGRASRLFPTANQWRQASRFQSRRRSPSDGAPPSPGLSPAFKTVLFQLCCSPACQCNSRELSNACERKSHYSCHPSIATHGPLTSWMK